MMTDRTITVSGSSYKLMMRVLARFCQARMGDLAAILQAPFQVDNPGALLTIQVLPFAGDRARGARSEHHPKADSACTLDGCRPPLKRRREQSGREI
jgi:hypothetical protein